MVCVEKMLFASAADINYGKESSGKRYPGSRSNAKQQQGTDINREGYGYCFVVIDRNPLRFGNNSQNSRKRTPVTTGTRVSS
ncbi:MAG: hypothetical protein ACOX1T_06995 [Saccharofermentanales bacterium]